LYVQYRLPVDWRRWSGSKMDSVGTFEESAGAAVWGDSARTAAAGAVVARDAASIVTHAAVTMP
jgi:hypothetical protein